MRQLRLQYVINPDWTNGVKELMEDINISPVMLKQPNFLNINFSA